MPEAWQLGFHGNLLVERGDVLPPQTQALEHQRGSAPGQRHKSITSFAFLAELHQSQLTACNNNASTTAP
jgi:hypothetical protein